MFCYIGHVAAAQCWFGYMHNRPWPDVALVAGTTTWLGANACSLGSEKLTAPLSLSLSPLALAFPTLSPHTSNASSAAPPSLFRATLAGIRLPSPRATHPALVPTLCALFSLVSTPFPSSPRPALARAMSGQFAAIKLGKSVAASGLKQRRGKKRPSAKERRQAAADHVRRRVSDAARLRQLAIVLSLPPRSFSLLL